MPSFNFEAWNIKWAMNSHLSTMSMGEIEQHRLYRLSHDVRQSFQQDIRSAEAEVQEILLEEPAISWKLQISPTREEFAFWPHDGSNQRIYKPWSFPMQESAKYAAFMQTSYETELDLLIAYDTLNELLRDAVQIVIDSRNTIQYYREYSADYATTSVEKVMTNFWSRPIEDIKADTIAPTLYHHIHRALKFHLNCNKENTDPEYYQDVVLLKLATPLLLADFEQYKAYWETVRATGVYSRI